MSFDEIFDLTAGVYFNFYNIPRSPGKDIQLIFSSASNEHEIITTTIIFYRF